MRGADKRLLENLTPKERERIVALLSRHIVEQKKERERLEQLKKIT
jgi:hypothetical protein|tara:strand:+ start:65 stop:202 length:138 start_codon:yes stop_codon:yes gene_type:complete